MDPKHDFVHRQSPPESKIALFRSLFRGRDDVYPRRFESRKTGKSGYQPACANEWAPGMCQKPKVKCADCQHRSFLPVTDGVIRWHLSGRDDNGRDFVMGMYPMLQDEACFFLAADFDKSHWQEDAQAILETCRRIKTRGGCSGAIALRQWRTCLAILPGGRPRSVGTQARFTHTHRNHGVPARHRVGFLRPFLPQSRHCLEVGLAIDRLTAAKTAARPWKQRICRRTGRSVSRSMGVPVDGRQDRSFHH